MLLRERTSKDFLAKALVTFGFKGQSVKIYKIQIEMRIKDTIQNPQSQIQNRMNRFINNNKDNWQRLEDLLGMMDVTSFQGLSRAEVREFGELYRRAATDLAIARAETRDPKLINYLNSLVIRAHGKIYRAESHGANMIWQFFTKELPQTFRKNWKFMAIAAFIEVLFTILGFTLAYNDLGFADAMGLDSVAYAAKTKLYWWQSANEANQITSSFLFTHNIQVSFNAFVLGAFFCLGSFILLAFNGLHFGGVLGICYKIDPDFGNQLATFVVAHGVIETSCIWFAGGAGIMIGYAFINPGDLTRAQALKKKGLEAVRIVIGCAFILVIAGLIEGFISPSSLPPFVKISVGIITGIAMYSYFLLAGRDKESDSETERRGDAGLS